MNVTTPFKRLPIVAKSLGIGLFFVSSLYAAASTGRNYPDTVWIPVTFYDYHPNQTAGFEQCMNNTGTPITKGMVQDTLSKDHKPLRTNLACNTDEDVYPCACALNNWFRPSGIGTATNIEFKERTVFRGGKDSIQTWYWTGLTKNTDFSTTTDSFFSVPNNYSSTAPGANLVHYSFLPFVLKDKDKGTYSFDRTGTNQFFWLDGKGFNNEPATANPQHNFAFTMEMHQEFTYQGTQTQAFAFSGDDDVWVYINNKLVLDLGGIHRQQEGSFSIDSIAKICNLEIGKKYRLDVFYTERHTSESNCRITSNLIAPFLDTIILANGNNVCPGDTIDIVGIVKDKDGNRMRDLEDSLKWEIVNTGNADTNDKLTKAKGPTARITATKAWRNITVKAWVNDPYNPSLIKSAFATISVDVCSPDHIVIEGSPTPRKWGDDSLRVATITDSAKIYNKMYAVVRDSFGNLADTITPAKWFTSYTATTWTSANTKIATVEGEDEKKYHGTATRSDSSGKVVVTASDGIHKPGTVIVDVTDYYFVKLRLVDLKTGKVVDTLRIETDSTGRYKIEGLKSTFQNEPNNPNAWVDAQGKIDLKDTLKTDCPLTTNGNNWTYCPTNHGTGRVILTNPNDPKTDTTIIPVIVTLSKPKLYLSIVTPENKRIAGDTIIFVATIKNDDGLIPIPYCFGGNNADIKDSIAYFDNLGRGGAAKAEPYTIVTDKVLLNFDNEKYHTSQCFINGVDTFGAVFFYAPYQPKSDSLHVLSAWAGNLQAKTDPFTLLPGPLYTLKFENDNWVEYQGPIILNPNDPAKLIFSTYSNGYDRYGNRRGHEEKSEWSVDGTLDPSKLSTQIGERENYITDENQLDGLNGNLIAQAKGIHDSTIVGRIEIIVLGQRSPIISAYTRDINGNGILDRIDVEFYKATKFTKDDGNLSIVNTNPGVSFVVDSIVPANQSGKNYYIYLAETDKSRPQTGWTPRMTLSNFTDAADTVATVADGAAPVVWRAHKQINSEFNRKKDVIYITLSEIVSKGGGSNLVTEGSKPELVFKIWEKVDGEFKYEDFMLKDIPNFDKIKQDSGNVSVFIFKMTNGQDITNSDWVNIFYENRLIADEKSNYTHELNQKVRFTVGGNVVTFQIIPNPAVPTTRLTNPGEVKYVESKSKAYEDIQKAGGGTVFKITFTNISDSVRMDIKLKVYDVIGNQVASLPPIKNVKALKDNDDQDSTVSTLLFEYGCTNEKGMKVAPGQYKVIAWITFSSKYKNLKKSQIFGIKKEDITTK